MATVTVGSTFSFASSPATLDGFLWDVTGATVTVVFRQPDGIYLERAATVTNGPQGLAQYTTLTTDLSVEGLWEYHWRFQKSGIDVRTQPVALLVAPALVPVVEE